MNRKIMPFMLLLIEVIMYYFICLYFHMDLDLIIGSGILYFLFLFIYGHYSLNTCLIWDEIKALVKSSFCFYIALLVLVPKSTGYERRMHLTIMVASMFIICLLADRYIRIAFRDQFARKTLVIGTGYEAARLGKISNNNRFALTQVEGYVDANWTDQLYDFKQENVIKNSFIYSYEELDEAIKTLKIEQIIVALPEASEEVIDKVIYLNGKRLVITGVNRHEWNPKTGRCIGMQEMTADIDCMLRNNINAVRTCHYPDQIPWYYLCDKAGIYVMAETNLESHGTFQKLGAIEPSCNVPGSIPQWREVVLDRAISNFETFKNHTSVLFWSLGNESYAGDDLGAMNTYFKEKRDGRLVHYESSFYNRAYEDTISDVESRMYAKPKEVEEYLNNNPKKPYLLCEFMHDMGNSLGGMESYIRLLDQYEDYQGGFIWDYIDQALFVKDEVTGRDVLRYGGDFDDRPSDYEFSGNGILFADRTEKPAMQEVRHYYGLRR